MYELNMNFKQMTYNKYTKIKLRKESKHNTDDSHQITRKENKIKTQERKRTTKTT